MRRRFYVGLTHAGCFEAFSQSGPPSQSRTPQYAYVIGPFKTKRGVQVMALYGRGNPHLRCVDDAERLAKVSRCNVNPRYGEIPATLPPCPVIPHD